MKNKINIIIPVYNAFAFLGECLECIRNQSSKDWICYLVNDGSTDNSQLIIDEYCSLDDRFVGMNKPNEGSPAKTIRYALKHIDSGFVTTIGDDDFVSADFVEKLMSRQRETEADIVVPRMCCFRDSVSNVLWTKPDDLFDFKQVVDGKTACLLTIPDWIIGMNGALIRKEMMYNTVEGEWSYSDELHEREMLVQCNRVAFTDAKYYYRFNSESITKAVSPFAFEKSIIEAQLVAFAKKYYPDNKSLIQELSYKHFSGLQSNIVRFETLKNRFSVDQCKRIEKAMAYSYELTDISEVFKRSLKWGLAVLLLRRFEWYQTLVIRHFR